MTRQALRGMTWDHARGFDPLHASVPLFEAQEPSLTVEWQRRSLSRFGAEPLQTLAERFDLLVIDHPFCGAAAKSQCLLDLSSLLQPALLEELRKDSVGPSTESYYYQGGIWALPTDAAAQVAAYRPDLLLQLKAQVPRNFAEVIALGQRARARDLWLGLPLCPGDAICTLLSLLANLGDRPSEDASYSGLDGKLVDEALARLWELKTLSHPSCTDSDPIRTYAAMTTTDEIVYVPFAFGYTNYARRGLEKPLRFCNIAGPGEDPSAGALLGGAGTAISRSCRDVAAAVRYLAFLHSAQHQRGAYFAHGGQPGRLSAWLDARNNQESGRFFLDTLETLTKAYRRPRLPGFVPFMEHAGPAIHRWLCTGGARPALVETLRRKFDEARVS